MAITSKSDINRTLDTNLTELSKSMQEISQSEVFTSNDQNYEMDSLCRNIFYYLADITDAIKLLNT